MNMNVLVVEDDPKVAGSLRQGLSEAGYETALARTVPLARALLARQHYALMVLDLGLPGGNGLDLLRELRAAGNTMPVIIVTARDEINDRVVGLDAGSDDYIVKPFAFAEVLARVNALLRRTRRGEGGSIAIADLRINPVHRSVERAGKPIELTPKEFDLLAYLVEMAGQVVSRAMLARAVWKIQSRATPVDNVIDVHMCHLRDKIDRDFEPALIQTVRGVGFMLKAP